MPDAPDPIEQEVRGRPNAPLSDMCVLDVTLAHALRVVREAGYEVSERYADRIRAGQVKPGDHYVSASTEAQYVVQAVVPWVKIVHDGGYALHDSDELVEVRRRG